MNKYSDEHTPAKLFAGEESAHLQPLSARLITPESLARQHEFKAAHANGKREWHGPNPTGSGASTDGFILNEDGTAYDRSQGQHYTSGQVAEAFGIEPANYAPVAEYRERNSHSQRDSHSATPAARTPKPEPKQPARKEKPKQPAGEKPTRELAFDYHDASGQVAFRVVRREYSNAAKGFQQQRPDGRGGWLNNLNGVARVLYRLSEVTAAETVWLAEGEKCADRVREGLEARGLSGKHAATTNPMGAGSWREEYTPMLAGKRVIVLPDNDVQGEKHTAKVCPLLHSHAARLQVLRLPDLAEGEDVVDFLEAGGTFEQVLALAEDAATWQPTARPTEEAGFEKLHDFPKLEASQIAAPALENAQGKPEYDARQLVEILRPAWPVAGLTTHAAHARRIAHYLGKTIAHSRGLGWAYYDGKQWRQDDKHATDVSGLVAPLSAVVREEAAMLFQHTSTLAKSGRTTHTTALTLAAHRLLKHAQYSESKSFTDDSLHFAASLLKVAIEQFNQKPWLLGFENGTWERGQWREHRRTDFLLHLSPVEVEAATDRTEWLQVLERITGSDSDFARTLQDVAAYVLSGASHLRTILWLYGPGGTGKSTFAELLQTVLGGMATSVDPKSLSGKAEGDRQRLGADLWNKRLAVCAEAGNQRLDRETLKTLSGSDTGEARFLFQEKFNIKHSHALMLVANDAPKMDAYDKALRERVIVLPFEHRLDKQPLVLTGGTRIEAVRSNPTSPLVRGFTAWALEGLQRLYSTETIYRAPVIEAACAKFWADTDTLTAFWETVDESQLRAGVTKAELRTQYESWCYSEGAPVLGRERWAKACGADGRGLDDVKNTKGVRCWRLVGKSKPDSIC